MFPKYKFMALPLVAQLFCLEGCVLGLCLNFSCKRLKFELNLGDIRSAGRGKYQAQAAKCTNESLEGLTGIIQHGHESLTKYY